MNRILSFVIKELIQIRRDKRMLAVVLVSPIIQLILLGYAANMDVKHADMTVLDFDKTPTSRKFVQTLLSSRYFYIYRYAENYNQIKSDIESGKAILGLVFPANFEKELKKSQSPKIQVILDGSNGNKTSIVLGYISNALAHFNKNLAEESSMNFLPAKFKSVNLVTPEIRVWYNPEMVTRNFLLPGIVALLLLIIAVPLTSMAIVRERENGTIEQIIISPLRSYEIIAGKIIPFLLIGLIDFTFVLSVMRFWFDIEIKGNIFLLYFSGFLFTLSNLGLGLLISTLSKSQQQAMIVSVFGLLVPMIYLSGFVFPVENMPKIIQPITYFIPLKYFLVILRGIVLKGIGLQELWVEFTILILFGITFFTFSSMKFKKILV